MARTGSVTVCSLNKKLGVMNVTGHPLDEMQGANQKVHDEQAETYKRYVGVGSDNAVHEADRQGVTSY